jgi:hypothetical protein
MPTVAPTERLGLASLDDSFSEESDACEAALEVVVLEAAVVVGVVVLVVDTLEVELDC